MTTTTTTKAFTVVILPAVCCCLLLTVWSANATAGKRKLHSEGTTSGSTSAKTPATLGREQQEGAHQLTKPGTDEVQQRHLAAAVEVLVAGIFDNDADAIDGAQKLLLSSVSDAHGGDHPARCGVINLEKARKADAQVMSSPDAEALKEAKLELANISSSSDNNNVLGDKCAATGSSKEKEKMPIKRRKVWHQKHDGTTNINMVEHHHNHGKTASSTDSNNNDKVVDGMLVESRSADEKHIGQFAVAAGMKRRHSDELTVSDKESATMNNKPKEEGGMGRFLVKIFTLENGRKALLISLIGIVAGRAVYRRWFRGTARAANRPAKRGRLAAVTSVAAKALGCMLFSSSKLLEGDGLLCGLLSAAFGGDDASAKVVEGVLTRNFAGTFDELQKRLSPN